MAVLVRLAMGVMLAEKGSPVPIILDDALVYCDDDRIQRMFDALSRAGKRQQIIVLTCRLRSFGSLGGRTLRLSHRLPRRGEPIVLRVGGDPRARSEATLGSGVVVLACCGLDGRVWAALRSHNIQCWPDRDCARLGRLLLRLVLSREHAKRVSFQLNALVKSATIGGLGTFLWGAFDPY